MPMRRLPLVTRATQLDKLCDILAISEVIAFDTEFVPEYSYHPQLCLLQVATDEVAAAVDPFNIPDLSPLWELLVDPEREVIMHAGAAELGFCLRATRRMPPLITDVQIAAGFVGEGYPISYKNLLQRFVDSAPAPQETRTDWRNRPLSEHQIKYALDDVIHLLPIRDALMEGLEERGRRVWFEDESDRLKQRILDQLAEPAWRRVSGAGALTGRELAVLIELAAWRDGRAEHLNKPIKQILRDDLLVELARRKPRTADAVRKLRGLGRLRDDRTLEGITQAVIQGLDTPSKDIPKHARRRTLPGEKMILKLLSAVMIHQAEANDIAPTLLGTTKDLQALLDWHERGRPEKRRPRLATGWRGKLCGEQLADFLAGQTSLRLDRQGDTPALAFVRT